jgi:hypothetical protein
MLFALLLPMPALFLLITLQDRFGFQTLTTFAAIGWLGTYLVFNTRWAVWPCPKCGQQFRNLWKPFAGHCQHCGLRQWSEN